MPKLNRLTEERNFYDWLFYDPRRIGTLEAEYFWADAFEALADFFFDE